VWILHALSSVRLVMNAESLTLVSSLSPQTARILLVSLISAVAGAVNSIAGGGTLLTFPALVGLGIPPIVANATNTMALWPGTVGSAWAYRGELAGARTWAVGFAIPSTVGGALGAWLLLRTPPGDFARLVPWLVLGATALFMVQGPIMKRVRRRAGKAASLTHDADSDAALTRPFPSLAILAYQLLVSIYGGYFGGGIGILMLAALGFMGLTNIHRMNGLKNCGGACINASAAAVFGFSSLVIWPLAIGMAVGAIAGGYGGARLAQRVPQRYVRYAIVAIGLFSGFWLLIPRR
jgi:uncharacterized membrane protein YfcA